jgi:hypothetical protein
MSALKLWNEIYEDTEGWLAIFSGVRPPTKRDGKPNKGALRSVRNDYYKWPEDKEKAAEYATNLSEQGHNVYQCPHLLNAPERNKRSASPITCLYADDVPLDYPGKLPPSVVVQSSPGSYQGYWKLEKPLDAPEAEILNKRLTYAIGADKNAWNLAQPLRVPGTINYDYAEVYRGHPKVLISEISNRRYDSNDLSATLPLISQEPSESPKSAYHRQDLSSDSLVFDPRSFLNHRQLRVYEGIDVITKEDGHTDRSASLFRIGRVLYQSLQGSIPRQLLPGTISECLRERDIQLGWHKYTARRDEDFQYQKITKRIIGS